MKASRFAAMLGAIVGIAGAAAAQSPGELDSSLGPQEGLTQSMLHGDPWTDILAKVDGRVASRPVQALPPIDCDTCH
jgi:hypothetical protein